MHSPKPRKIVLLSILFFLILLGGFSYFHNRRVIQYQEYLQELRSLAYNKYLAEPAGFSDVSTIGLWDAYHFTDPKFQCVNGGPYVILVHNGTQSDKTILWMEVGDECWPGHPQCGGAIESGVSQEEALNYLVNGLDISPFGPISSDPDNPLSQWNYIYLPTCDGSWHFGDAAADYDDDGNPDHWHNGLRQTSAAVSLMRQLFPDSQKILVFGSSNGGFGTLGATPIVRLAFPDIPLYVLDDSGPGVFNPDNPDVWPVIQQSWNLAPMFPLDCTECTHQLVYLFDWMLRHDSNLKVGLFSSYQDLVVSSVLSMTPEQYQNILLETTDKIHQSHPDRFQRFFVKGRSHCINDYYRSIDNVTVWDWLDYLVNDDERWVDLLQ